MTLNVGMVDRVLRALAGVVLIALALGYLGEPRVWGWIGVIPLATAFMGNCPLYSVLGISTCKRG